jgi:hypothetical protein
MSAERRPAAERESVEMPAPTVAPLVVALGIALAAAGVALNVAFILVGAALAIFGLGVWIGQLLPGRGHTHEPLVEPSLRARQIAGTLGAVQQIRPGMPGYRLRLPERVHPISAGIKGGLLGGLVMPLPALLYCLANGRGIWLPVNLLAGMVLPGVDTLAIDELEQFRPTLLAIGAALHVTVSLTLGLIYGVLMPTLPRIPKPLAWGALLMPVFWTALSFTALGVMNPQIRGEIDWPWFIVSQFLFGVVAAAVFMRFARWRPVAAGLLGGIVGGLLMPIPAVLWGVFTWHGIWYPVNLLAAMVVRHAGALSPLDLRAFHAEWFLAALATHAVLSIGFGLAFGLVLPRIPAIASPIVWGGVVMPILWTASSYGLMGVVNPALQEHVDWPWFIASQFVFGIVAALVVVRSEMIAVAPAGRAPDRSADFLTE